jgi:hypothetical protein
MYQLGEKKIYGQMVARGDKRGDQLVKRMGFDVVDKVEVTKYKHIIKDPIFLFTAIGDLEKFHENGSKNA